MKGAVLDYLHSGKLISHEPEYRCARCGQNVKNYDLSEVLERRIYGHVTCPCIMGDIRYREEKRQRYGRPYLAGRAYPGTSDRQADRSIDLGDMPW